MNITRQDYVYLICYSRAGELTPALSSSLKNIKAYDEQVYLIRYIKVNNQCAYSKRFSRFRNKKLKKIYKKEIDNLIFIYEPTGNYSYWITQFCALKEIQVFMVNSKQSHNFAKAIGQRGKSDKVDAKMLSLCRFIAQEGEIRVPVVNKVEQEIKELIGYYKFTTKQRVQASNHLESIQIKDGSVYAIKDLAKEIKNFRLKEKYNGLNI